MDAVQIEVRDRQLEVVQALLRGQRRLIRAELPCVVAIGATAPVKAARVIYDYLKEEEQITR